MRSLSKEAESKLIGAIEQAATFVNAGHAPNDAIIKSAAAANIPAGHINLMVHAYNTGRTAKQREHGETTMEKAADFQLADADVVLNALYPKTVKTSSVLTTETVVSTEYAVSPRGFIARRQAQIEKAAAAQVALPEKTFVPPPRDEHAAAMRSMSQKYAEKRAADERRRHVTIAYNKAAQCMDDLYEYFRKPGSITFGDALHEVDLRMGIDGVSVLNKLAAVYPHLEKQAAHREPIYGNGEPFTLVAQVIEAIEEYNTAKEATAQDEIQPEFHKKTAQVYLTGSIMPNPEDAELTLKIAAEPDKKKDPKPAQPPLTSFSGTLKNMGNIMGRATFGGTDAQLKKMQDSSEPAALKSKAYASLTGPDHENKLQQIKARGVLNDLILNDPVISGYDANEIAEAYNQISELAPNFTGSGAAMQALLRKRLEAGQLADFDIKQLIELEKLRAEGLKSTLESQDISRKLL